MQSPSSRLLASGLACLVLGLGSVVHAQASDDILEGLGEPEKKPTTTAPEAPPPQVIEAAPAPRPAPAAEGPKSKAASAEESATASLDRIKAVPRKTILKHGRVELTPYGAASLNDPYYQHLALSGTVVFYPQDSFGLGIGGDYLMLHVKTRNIDAVRKSFTSVPAIFELPSMFAHVDGYWVPLYGKLSFFASDIIHFEMYAVAGMGAALAGNRKPLAVNVGVGQRFALSDWLALRFEVRDHLFLDTAEVEGMPRSDIQSYLLFQAGFSIYLPPSFEYAMP